MSVTQRRPHIGDIIEFKTRNGLAYAQYTHDHEKYGELVRIMPGVYDGCPADFAEMLEAEPQFWAFLPLAGSVREGLVAVVGNADVPSRYRPFPLFKDAWTDLATGEPIHWWLWDGNREWRVDELTDEQRKLSPAMIWNAAAIADAIAEGWSPEDSFEPRSLFERKESDDEPEQSSLKHYLYFVSESSARESAEKLRHEGYDVTVELGAEGTNWLVLASRRLDEADDMASERDRLERLASSLGGEYDGWEAGPL